MSSADSDFRSADHEQRPATRPSPGLVVLAVLLAVAAGLFVWRFWLHWNEPGGAAAEEPEVVIARGSLRQEQQRAEDVYKKAKPSVVYVTRLGARRDRLTLSLQEIKEGTGSGFVWDDQGHVVTNEHVVAGVTFGVSVTLADHSTYPAQVVDAFPDKDLAVLWIGAPREKLHPITVGTSKDLRVGQSAYAIGNPFGLDQSLTTGIISALGRVIQTESGKRLKNAIQTSAAINPGNSGGPLLDGGGRLIGINSAILSPSGAWAGVGFAIPVDEVKDVVSRAISSPRPLRAALGITLASDAVRRQLGASGPLIMDVLPGSAAAKAGLRPTRRSEDGDFQMGDVLVSVAGQPVRTLEDIHRALSKHQVGEQIAVVILRDGEQQTVTLTLGAAR